MNISRIFIERPVMTTLLMAALVIFGIFGYSSLPVSELPNVDFPTIQVSASLPGADPDTMASAVATPLENPVLHHPRHRLDDLDQHPGLDQHHPAVRPGPQHRRRRPGRAGGDFSAARASLPKALPQPPTFRKVNPTDQPIMFIAHAAPTRCRSTTVDEYAETLLARQISTIDGVAQVNVFGQRKYAVRIQADPDALAARSIGIDTLAERGRRRQCQPGHRRAERPHQCHASSTPTASSTMPRDFRNQIIAYQQRRAGAARRRRPR